MTNKTNVCLLEQSFGEARVESFFNTKTNACPPELLRVAEQVEGLINISGGLDTKSHFLLARRSGGVELGVTAGSQ